MGGYGKRFRLAGSSRRKRFITGSSGDASVVSVIDHTYANTRSMRFNGGAGGLYVSSSYNSALNWDNKTKFSISMWIKHDDAIAGYNAMTYAGQWLANTQNVWRVHQRSTTAIALFVANRVNETGANFGQITNSGVVTGSAWNHYLFTYDGDGAGNSDKLKGYLNGVSQSITMGGTLPMTMSAGTADFTIGAPMNSAAGSYFGPGQIDEVSVYEECLSQSQVTAIYNTNNPVDLTLLSNSANLRYYFRLGEHSQGAIGHDTLFEKQYYLPSASIGFPATRGLIANMTSSATPFVSDHSGV